ncbi:MAG: hypothetical protein V8Q79_10535 [Christensenellales bacterium]
MAHPFYRSAICTRRNANETHPTGFYIQTLRFFVKEDFPEYQAAAQVSREVEHYKGELDRNHIAYKILDEKTLDDGSIVLKLIKQYNQSPVGDYLD